MHDRGRFRQTLFWVLGLGLVTAALLLALAQSRRARILAGEVTRQAQTVQEAQSLAATAEAHMATAVASAEERGQAAQAAAEEAATARADVAEAQGEAAQVTRAARLFGRALEMLDQGHYDLGLLLAAEAARLSPPDVARQSLYQALSRHNPHLAAYNPQEMEDGQGLGRPEGSPRPVIIPSGNTIRLQEPASGDLRCEITLGGPAEENSVTDYVLHPQRPLLATAQQDGRVHLWDTGDCAEVGPLPASRRGTVWTLRFSPDGRFLVAAGEGQPLLLWDLEANTPITLPSNVEPAPHSPVTFSPDGRFLALESAEALLLWDLSEGRLLASLDAGTIPALVDLAIEPDGGALVALAVDGSVHRWVLGAGAPTHTTARLPVDWYEDPRQGAYKAIAFSPHGRHLALVECAQELMIVGVCLTGQLKVWQLAAGAPSLLIAEDLDGDFEGQPGLSFSDDGRRLWTWGDYRQRYLWDLAPPAPLSSKVQEAQPTSLSSAADLQKLVFHRGTLWDLAQKKPVERFPFPVTGALEAVAWSEDGRVLAECQKDAQGQRVVSRWETDTWELIHRFELPSTAGRVLFSPDLQTVLLQTGQHVALWDAQEGNPLGVLSCTSDIYEVVVSQDGRLFAYNCWSKGVHLREIRTGEAIRVIEDTPLTIAFSPDGQTLAVGEEELRLWHTGTGAEKGPALDVVDRMARISDVAFSPDGSYLAIADIFGGLQLWDAVSYRSIHRLRPSAMPEDYGYSDDSDYTYVAFTPNGQHLLSAGPYQVPLVWDVGQGALTARICRITNRNLTHREWARYVGDEPYHRTCPGAPLPEH